MDELPEPANLKFLRRLVTVLMVVMICGVLVIAAALVTRLRSTPPTLPAEITLPDGATATAFTQGTGWFAIVTDDDRILIYDRLSGALKQEVTIK